MSRSNTDDTHWPALGKPARKLPPCELGPPVAALDARVQPACTDQSSLAGVGERLSTTARPAHPRLTLKTEPEARTISFSQVVRRGSPPPSPTCLPPVVLDTSLKRYKPSTQAHDRPDVVVVVDHGRLIRRLTVAADPFPPLSPTTSSPPNNNNSSTPIKQPPARQNSYAAATARPTTTGASVVSESPVSFKMIRLNIGSVDVDAEVDTRPATPARSTPRKRRGTSGPTHTLSPPLSQGRNRSASVSSVATSVITTSSRGPASSKTSLCHTPTTDETEWQLKLAALAQALSNRDRGAWEKILRCDPKDTSKIKWNTFDKALKALKFRPQARGGSETEYTPDPEYFGTKAQPISYHRPHPGADFTLGDLKAKSNSFRQQYAAAVAVLHEAWGVVDTRQ